MRNLVPPDAAPRGKPRTLKVWLTIGDDDKACVSYMRPQIATVLGTDRRGVYPLKGEIIWIPGQCLEGVLMVCGRVPPRCVPTRCRMTLEIIEEDEP